MNFECYFFKQFFYKILKFVFKQFLWLFFKSFFKIFNNFFKIFNNFLSSSIYFIILKNIVFVNFVLILKIIYFKTDQESRIELKDLKEKDWTTLSLLQFPVPSIWRLIHYLFGKAFLQ